MNHVMLNNGVSMPQLGLGVWKVVDEKKIEDVIVCAADCGYRLIDTATIYGNEDGVGRGIKASGIPREELFITTKVWNIDQGYEETLAAFERSLAALDLDYIDLYLVHWPVPRFDKYVETYKALEVLYKEKKVRAIGVCNFEIHHLERLMKECQVVPAVNQVECHPYLNQKELKAFCLAHNIQFQAWSPIMQGGAAMEREEILGLAQKHGKTPAQIILRWHLQNDSVVIPKSATPSRIKENISVFDFELSPEDMAIIDGIDCGVRVGPHPNEMYRVTPR